MNNFSDRVQCCMLGVSLQHNTSIDGINDGQSCSKITFNCGFSTLDLEVSLVNWVPYIVQQEKILSGVCARGWEEGEGYKV